MSDTKPVTMEDGTPVPEDLKDEKLRGLAWEGIAGCLIDAATLNPEDTVNEEVVVVLKRFFGERIARAEARIAELETHLETHREAISMQSEAYAILQREQMASQAREKRLMDALGKLEPFLADEAECRSSSFGDHDEEGYASDARNAINICRAALNDK